MNSDSRYDISDRVNSIRSAMYKFQPDEPFTGTFQPSSYSIYPDSRSFENYLNSRNVEDVRKYRDSQSFDFRSRSSLGFDKSLQQSGNYTQEKPDIEEINKYEQVISHKEAVINDLKHQKAALSQEIDELIQRIKDKDAQNELESQKSQAKIEEFKYRVQENEEFIQTLQHELLDSHKDSEEYREKLMASLRNEDFSHLQSEFKSVKAINENLTQQIQILEQKLASKPLESTNSLTEFTVFKLQEQIKHLQEANENLSLSLTSRPTFKDVKDKENIISQLKERLRGRSSRSRSTSQPRKSMQKDKELFKLQSGELPSSSTLNILFTELLEILKLDHFGEIIAAVRRLKKKGKSSDLEEKLARLVRDLSPEGNFHPLPSPGQTWKWIRKVVEEYSVLKKNLEKEEKNKVIVNRLQGALGISDSALIINEVNSLIGESHANQMLREKIDMILEKDPKAQLKEFQFLVNEFL